MACRLLVSKTRQNVLLNFFCLVLFSALLVAIVFSSRDAVARVNVRLSHDNITSSDEELLSWEGVEEANLELMSKCSRKADARGRRQKVMAFSLYGELSDPSVNYRYMESLIENAQDLTTRYPGWVMRIYHNITSKNLASWQVLNENFGQDSKFWRHVDLCYVNDIKDINKRPLFPMTWRFLPMLDEFVDVFVSRDTDSLISQREIEAVHEWLVGKQMFHVMRDHPHHCVAILGGLWGAKLTEQRAKTKEIANKMLIQTNHAQRPGFDQDLLRKFLWPYARNSMMSHDSYCCNGFRTFGRSVSLTRPFPSQRSGHEFVGKVGKWMSGDDQWPSVECPAQCRPAEHPEWKFC